MKKSILSIFVAVLATFSVQTAQAQEYRGLPQNARKYVQKHFAEYTISHYEKDEDLLDVEHKVYVTDTGTTFKLEFDRHGNVKEIKSVDDKTALPKSVIPVKMSQHVIGKFPNAKVVEWKRKRNTQVLELSNDVEMVFSSKGDFLHIDD